jgi:hypothetical protein
MVAEYVKYTKSQYRHEVYKKFIYYKITIIFKALLSRTYGGGPSVSEHGPVVDSYIC